MKKIEVVAGIIFFQDQILCVQRPKSKLPYISEKFEFPGGKIEDGETQKEALQRELLEELNISTIIKSFFHTVVHEYPDFELTMHSFTCEVDTKQLTMNEHINQEWLKVDELKNLGWAAADLKIINELIKFNL